MRQIQSAAQKFRAGVHVKLLQGWSRVHSELPAQFFRGRAEISAGLGSRFETEVESPRNEMIRTTLGIRPSLRRGRINLGDSPAFVGSSPRGFWKKRLRYAALVQKNRPVTNNSHHANIAKIPDHPLRQ